MERMKELTVCIQNEYEWNVIYRTELYTEEEYKQLEEENKKLKEIIKDHQFYEEKLEHRIIEFEELLHWE